MKLPAIFVLPEILGRLTIVNKEIESTDHCTMPNVTTNGFVVMIDQCYNFSDQRFHIVNSVISKWGGLSLRRVNYSIVSLPVLVLFWYIQNLVTCISLLLDIYLTTMRVSALWLCIKSLLFINLRYVTQESTTIKSLRLHGLKPISQSEKLYWSAMYCIDFSKFLIVSDRTRQMAQLKTDEINVMEPWSVIESQDEYWFFKFLIVSDQTRQVTQLFTADEITFQRSTSLSY